MWKCTLSNEQMVEIIRNTSFHNTDGESTLSMPLGTLSITDTWMIYASIFDSLNLHSLFSVYPSLEIPVADQLELCVIITDTSYYSGTLWLPLCWFSVLQWFSPKFHALFSWVLQRNNKLTKCLEQKYLYCCFVKSTPKYQRVWNSNVCFY